MRYLRGFIQIQEMVDRAIIKLHAGNNSITQTPAELQQMPATCYKSDTFMGYVYPYIVPLVMALSWLFSVAHCIKSLTAYRETGLEEVRELIACYVFTSMVAYIYCNYSAPSLFHGTSSHEIL